MRARPNFVAFPFVADVGDEAAADVVARVLHAPYHLAGAGVAELAVVGLFLLLVHHENLEALAGGIEIAEVEGVAVAEAGAVEQRTVVVDAGRAVDNLVAAVAVNVADGERVGAFAVGSLAGSLALVEPTFGEGSAVEIPCAEV